MARATSTSSSGQAHARAGGCGSDEHQQQAAHEQEARLGPAAPRCGRASSAPSKMLSISSAWISTPSSAAPPAIVRRSDRPSAVTPTSTSLRSNSSRGDGAGQHVGRRDEAGRRAAGVAEPHRAVGLRRERRTRRRRCRSIPPSADRHRERPARRRATRNISSASVGIMHVADQRDQRDPAHGAALGIGVEQAVAGRRVVDRPSRVRSIAS